jgi:hypothetical protein
MHVRSAEGLDTTVATWTDGVPTLLPRAHAVMLCDAETMETFPVRWDTLAVEVDLMPVGGMYPARYRVEHHPDGDAMARLRAAPGMW